MFEHEGVSFSQAMGILPEHIGIWLNTIMITALLGLIFIKKREAQVVFVAFLISIPFTLWVYSEVGIASRLVGLGHVVFWLPAAVFGLVQIWRKQLYKVGSIYQGAFVVWLAMASTFFLASNFWDVPDTVRYVVNGCTPDTVTPGCTDYDLVNRIAAYRANK